MCFLALRTLCVYTYNTLMIVNVLRMFKGTGIVYDRNIKEDLNT